MKAKHEAQYGTKLKNNRLICTPDYMIRHEIIVRVSKIGTIINN